MKVKVMTVSLETHSLSDIIPIIHSSRGVIGMHGSLLSLAGFLKQGSFLVELFPYAVNPEKYTPYRSFEIISCESDSSYIVFCAR
jgi:protein O-mannose beta-1,4-N-acetylglucosaminyltransferase